MQVTTGFDARHIHAFAALLTEQARELGQGFAAEEWLLYGARQAAVDVAEDWGLAVAWLPTGKPVGGVECKLERDPVFGARVAVGDRAYVVSGYRQLGVFTALRTAVELWARRHAAERLIAPVGVDDTGAFLERAYRKNGYEKVAVMMSKEL